MNDSYKEPKLYLKNFILSFFEYRPNPSAIFAEIESTALTDYFPTVSLTK